MNFIKVHSDNSTCLINVDNVEMLNAEHGDDKVSVRFIDGTVGLGIVETVDELAAMLLPGPVVIKELEPAAIHFGTETGCPTVESFLRTMREGTSNECGRHGSCEACRYKEQSVICWFRALTGSEIRTIAAEYRHIRNLEQQEATNG